jgi:HD superfamily phosphohydrolase
MAALGISGQQMTNELEKQELKIVDAMDVSDDLGVVNSLEERRVDITAWARIGTFNQLGIKDYLRGTVRRKEKHTRGAHAKGTALIGRLYLAALSPFIPYTKFKGLFDASRERFEKLVIFALYLHDVGHLPYSHMVEEVFNEVNWARAKGKSHRHDEAQIEQLPERDRNAIKDAMQTTLDLSTDRDAGADAFEFLLDLMAGVSGVPFLDAIVNSSVDADKIDYIFRDMDYAESRTRLREDESWLLDFLSNISLSPEGLVRLNSEASICVLELLEERQFLYRSLYLDPKIRAFERIASVIVGSWLTREVSQNLIRLWSSTSPAEGVFLCEPDLRKEKGDFAHKRIVDRFLEKAKTEADPELELLLSMCDELSNDEFRDEKSRRWFEQLKARLKTFRGVLSSRHLSEQYNEIIVREPFYVRRGPAGESVAKAREIARTLCIDYPCTVLFDIAEYPRFLPFPKSRNLSAHGEAIIGETFLVPDREPKNWSRNSVGRFPLHCCDFTPLEKDYAQVVVVNTLPGEINAPYLLDLFLRRCRNSGVDIAASIWR